MRQLSPKLEKWLESYYWLINKMLADGFKQTPTNAREGLAGLTETWIRKKLPVQWIQDDLVEGETFDVPVRIYHPKKESSLPVLVYFHGGGHMAGSITVYDPLCRRLARETDHIVISTDYRLAPECPYPAGITDAMTVVQNLWEVLDRRQVGYTRVLSIAGDSAGGAICATVAHNCQYSGNPDIKKQALIYPSLDYTLQFGSLDLNGEGYLLHKDKISWYFNNYFQNNEDRRAVSPLYMDVTPALAQTLVVTAEFCPLRDEGIAYLHKLHQSGVSCDHLHFDNMIHTFMNMELLAEQECGAVYKKIGDFLNRS
jgi:acetyl esterase